METRLSKRMFWEAGFAQFSADPAVFRADAKMPEFELQAGELRAGEMLRLAGFSAGTGVGAREGNGGAIRNSGRGSRSARRGRSDYDVLRSVHACCLPLSAKQDGLR